MGIKQDLKRFKEVGEERRMDLEEFMIKGDMGKQIPGENMKIPIKNISLPEFEYDRMDMGGVGQAPEQDGQQGQGQGQQQGQGQGQQQGQGKPQPGDPAGPPRRIPQDGDGDGDGDGEEPGEPGEGEGDHGYYEISPEEFAEEIDEKYELDMEPKGKKIKEQIEGALKERAPQGPRSTLDKELFFKNGLKRKVASYFDKDYMKEALRVKDQDAKDVYQWATTEKGIMNVGWNWLRQMFQEMQEDEDEDLDKWESFEELDEENEYTPVQQYLAGGGADIEFSEDDMFYKYPEIKNEYEKNAVIFNIRDVSGSMGEEKRELVERTFTTLDYYLKGKYDNVEFVYIAHDSQAQQVDGKDFFGIQSGGGTRISSGYELAKEIQDEQYPEEEWNIFVFGAGDGENWAEDTKENVIPLMNEIPANRHSYIVTQPRGGHDWATHGEELRKAKENGEFEYDVNVSDVNRPEDVPDAIVDTLHEAG